MSLVNVALLYNLSLTSVAFQDDLLAGGNNSQTGAWPLVAEVSRCTKSGATTNSFVLKSVLSGEAAGINYIINDSANTINVFPAVGETQNGVLNQGLAIAAGAAGICIMVPNSLGGPTWRSAAIT